MAKSITNINLACTLSLLDNTDDTTSTDTHSVDITGDELAFLVAAYIENTHQRVHQEPLDPDGATPAEKVLTTLMYAPNTSIARHVEQLLHEQIQLETGDDFHDKLAAYLHADKKGAIFPSHSG